MAPRCTSSQITAVKREGIISRWLNPTESTKFLQHSAVLFFGYVQPDRLSYLQDTYSFRKFQEILTKTKSSQEKRPGYTVEEKKMDKVRLELLAK